MDASNKPTMKETSFDLPETFTVFKVNELFQQWSAFSYPCDMIINASVVKEVDTAALQLLTVFIKSAIDHKKTIKWQPQPSTFFCEEVERGGLNENLFQIPKEQK